MWMMAGQDSNRFITIKLSDSAISNTILRGTFITAKNISSNYSYVDKVIHLTVGDKKSYLKVNTKKMLKSKMTLGF